MLGAVFAFFLLIIATTAFTPLDRWTRNSPTKLVGTVSELYNSLLSTRSKIEYEPRLSTNELLDAGKIAWRNHARCIGRLNWNSLKIRDDRHLETAEQVFESLLQHYASAHNNGDIRSIMTVFLEQQRPHSQCIRIWNSQVAGYAGYRLLNGTLVGDPENEAFTTFAISLGWKPPKNLGRFDLLPLIVSGVDGKPRVFEIPKGFIPEVIIKHPHFEWFEELGLRWYSLPVVCNMGLDLGKNFYQSCPFNGWYVCTEIGSRNLGDEGRYNMLPEIATRMGLDIKKPRSLWRDRAMMELNEAVLYSYQTAKVRMLDHHTASDEYVRFCKQEARAGREVSSEWAFIVPPAAPSATKVFFMNMFKQNYLPDYRKIDHVALGVGSVNFNEVKLAKKEAVCPFTGKSKAKE